MNQKTTGRDHSVGGGSLIVVPLQSKDHFASLTCNKAKIHQDAIRTLSPLLFQKR